MRVLKFVLSIVTMLLFNVVVGGVFAGVLGVDPVYTVGALTVLSSAASFVRPLAGVLPMAITVTSAYAGEVLEELLVRATTGNQLVAGGHIRVQPNVTKKFSIPRLRAGRMLQKRKEMPTDTDSKGDFTIDEKYLEPKDLMAFTTFNPRVFENIWRPFQPTGNLVFAELPPHVQTALLAELAKVVDFELGNEFINGKEGNSEGQYFDGVLTRIVDSEDVIRVSSLAPLTSTNIISKMKAVRGAIPKAIRANKDLKLFMSVEDAEIYEYELTDRPHKGADYTNMNPERFKGIRIVPLADWPKDVIVAAVTSTGVDSNFWAGVSLVDDQDAILIDKLTNAGEKYFFKMLMKADTNIVFDEEIVLYDAREEAIAANSTQLSALSLSAGTLAPTFKAGTRGYTIEVENSVSVTTVTAKEDQEGQVLKLGSETLESNVASGERNLAVGENIFVVEVTSADGFSTGTYTVLVTRAQATGG
ncbi:MAG TPA: cadherin-like beta sandwich domain-containing protein [Bacteroidales bacterium]|jgi:hypothetical protein|nr:cadherin-like beta sandwich domain-containing protein [Bacteroidales bacterium]